MDARLFIIKTTQNQVSLKGLVLSVNIKHTEFPCLGKKNFIKDAWQATAGIQRSNMKYWYRFYFKIWDFFGYESCGECTKLFKKDTGHVIRHGHWFCAPCAEYNFCECGIRLENGWGSPGDGFCRRCD